MPEFKERPKMDKPKGKPTAAIPKQTARMVQKKYCQQLNQRPDGEENETTYATDRVEVVGRQTVDGVKSYAPRPQQRQPKDCPKERDAEHKALPTRQTKAENFEPKTRFDNTLKTKEGREKVSSRQQAPSVARQRKDPVIKEAPAQQVVTPPAHGSLTRPQEAQRKAFVSSRRARATEKLPSDISHTSKPPRIEQRISGLKVRSKTMFKTRSKLPQRPSSPIKNGKPPMRAAKAVKQAAQRHMKQQMVTRAQKAAKATTTATKKIAQAVVKAVASIVSSLVGLLGGGVLLVILLLVAVIAAIANSPFGIFFSGEGGTGGSVPSVSVSEAVGSINAEYNGKLEQLQAGGYDKITLTGQAADWPDVLAVFSSRYAAAEDGVDVATLDADRVSKLTSTFWDMTEIETEVETIHHSTEDGDGWTERILHITVTAKTAENMKTAYSFTDYQISALDELLVDRAALASLAGSLTITNADVQAVVNALPMDLSAGRRKAVENALQLVGKVNYFWGGKSYVIGWDSRWGQLAKVTSAGSPSTGTYRPYGLDCTGFMDWALRNAGLPSDGHWYVGTNLTEVSQANALPGDMALYPDASHIGMVVGRDSTGKLLICHCSSGRNNVVVTEFATSGFTALGRLAIFAN